MGLLGKLRSLGLAAMLCLSGAAGAEPPPVVRYHAEPLSSITLHADQGFTQHERGLLEFATWGLLLQTAGYLDIKIVYDLDPGLLIMPGWSLLRVDSSTATWVETLDGIMHGHVLGLTDSNRGVVFLFVDRITDHEASDVWFVHVAMHELLHVAGVDHTEKGAVMTAITPVWFTPEICINYADALEFCRTRACVPRELNFCTPRP